MRFGIARHILLSLLCLTWLIGGPAESVVAQEKNKTDVHPVILGFERFYASEKNVDPAAGRLLLGELSCTSCHMTDDATIGRKQAPILEGVGQRLRPSYLKEFLANPHAVKPGSSMPNVLEALPAAERNESANALVHFLASTGSFKDVRPQPRLASKGQTLYQMVGCTVCHGPRNGEIKEHASILPLSDLAKKYSITSLSSFLLDPHKTRPSGRMPSLSLKNEEALQIANYLLADLKLAGPGGARAQYAYYEFDKEPGELPDFTKLKPAATGLAADFDVGLARRNYNVALKFDAFLRIDNPGKYTFFLGSDDGSRLWIDGKLVVDNDGLHATTHKTSFLEMKKGVYPITVAVFNAGGDFVLSADVQGPKFGQIPLSDLTFPTREAAENPVKTAEEKVEGAFVLNPKLARKGEEQFASLGCASCHSLSLGKGEIKSSLVAPALANLNPTAGCLAEVPTGKAPRYHLSAGQRASLAAGLASPSKPLSQKEQVDQTLTAFNCYACHQRGGKGGVETGLNEFFKGTQPEMGDEGRVPPHLEGVGAKLNAPYLRKILANGINDRPYMLTRMPKFGESNVGHMQQALEALDANTVEPFPTPKLSVAVKKAKSEGRFMVGNQAFGCVKCHNFREHNSGGVQGMNMTVLTERLKHDWFARYLLDPNKFRPQTRMPAIWPFGQSQLPKILGGDTDQQIEAVWLYLSDGNKASIPFGVGRQPIPLEPTAGAIVYRNFIEGAGPRAIGVGYPEHINLAFDANDLRYALLWHNQFMDASRHWTDRGSGFEPPLGDGILHLPPGPSFAILDTKDQPWPRKAEKDKGYKFRGYTLDDKDRPTFKYSIGEIQVEDFMLPVEGKENASLKRNVTIDAGAGAAAANLYYRAIAGPKITDQGKGWFEVGELRTRVEAPGDVLLRTIGSQMEVLVPVTGKNVRIIQEYHW